ncbi:MAG: HEAT repeat domain-containing protein [Planctomycetes bacterium]|nr:HEAT repeat domain-containing protein [Planctomycetota bacterium]
MRLNSRLCAALALPLGLTPLVPVHGGRVPAPPPFVGPSSGFDGPAPGTYLPGNGGPTGGLGGGPIGGPSQPTRGGSPGGPAAGSRRTTTPSIGAESDATQWRIWWEFNKEPFLIRARARSRADTYTGDDDIAVGRGLIGPKVEPERLLDTDYSGRIVPALVKTLRSENCPDNVAPSALIALAKTKRDDEVLATLRRFLGSDDQECRETAALSLGIAGRPIAADVLIDIANDSAAGRATTGRSAGIDVRTRAFALYGLGLLARANDDIELDGRVFECCKHVLEDRYVKRRDLPVAALHALGMLHPVVTYHGVRLRHRAIELVFEILGTHSLFAHIRDPIIHAHAATALGELVARRYRRTKVMRRFVRILRDHREATWLHQSAALALGRIAFPDDEDALAALRNYQREGRDRSARYFSMIALGKIGGESARLTLRRRLVDLRTRSNERPWLAIALALLEVGSGDDARSALAREGSLTDLRSVYRKTKNASDASGIAIALGIVRDSSAADSILERMAVLRNDDDAAGYHAIALGMIGHVLARSDLHAIASRSLQRGQLMARCTLALSLLGDTSIGSTLVHRLASRDLSLVEQSAIVRSLGYLADRNSLHGLVTLLTNERAQAISRDFAASALGLLADRDEIPWTSRISVGINYLATCETLIDRYNGVLDIF